MADGWFPRYSPSGSHLARGSVTLTVDGVVWSGAGGGISGAWLFEDVLLYRQHDTGALRRVAAGLDEAIGPPCAWVAARAGRYACWALRDGVPVVWTGDGRQWVGYGGGWGPMDLAPDGTLVLGHHATGALELVAPGATVPVRIADEGRTPRCGASGVVWVSGTGRLGYAPLRAPHVARDVTVPGEACHGPVLVDTPDGEWLLTHTSSDRLLLLPLSGTDGYVVAEGDTRYPDAVWTPAGVRVAWSDGHGTPGEALVDLGAPRVDLTARAVWHVVGTEVDTLPFMVPDYPGTLRCPADGQTLQTVRTGPKEVACLKGNPARQERWTWDDQAVYLVYDHSDGRAQPWRITPTPVWCRRVSFVGDSQVYAGTELIRRTATGSTREPFPVRTSVYGYGEHIPIAGIGRCRILSTTWEPHYPDSQYQERHWWAIRESDGLRLGRVRYEEWRRGVLERAFDFSELLPDQRIEPAPMLHIPDPPAPIPDPAPTPEPMPQTIQPPPRDEILRCLTWLRDEVYPGLVGHPIDDEGIAAWLVDTYTVDARLRRGLSHEAAMHHTFAAIERTVHPPVTPDPAPDPPVTPPASGGLVGPLRIG